MELIILIAPLVALVLFALFALRFGVDTRDGIADPPQGSL